MIKENEFQTIGELLEQAQSIESPFFEYISSGSGDETTLRRNREALQRLTIAQRVLPELNVVDTTVDFFGVSLPTPTFIAPVGISSRLFPDGDIEMVHGAGSEGNLLTVTANASPLIEKMATEATAPLMFQLHLDGEPTLQSELLERVHACPTYKFVTATVHSSLPPRIDRHLSTGAGRQAVGVVEPPAPRFTWSEFDRLRAQVSLPFGPKGIMNASDVRDAVDHGADFIWISNHGGRLLDAAQATIDVLPAIVEAAGELPVVIDGGFERGSDVMKAVALGASLVGFAKLPAYALSLGGASSVASLLRILQMELERALVYSGRTSLSDLSPDLIGRF